MVLGINNINLVRFQGVIIRPPIFKYGYWD
jgi:hypothetical protein